MQRAARYYKVQLSASFRAKNCCALLVATDNFSTKKYEMIKTQDILDMSRLELIDYPTPPELSKYIAELRGAYYMCIRTFRADNYATKAYGYGFIF